MRRDDIMRAKKLDDDLAALETKLAFYQNCTKFDISAGCCLELQDYPQPSRIGHCFRLVRDAITAMIEAQIHEIHVELGKLGVKEIA